MSKVKLDSVWQHDKVLPYIMDVLKPKIEAITPIHHMYLTGSRSKTPLQDWGKLQGKDWDILVVCKFRIINTAVWTTAVNYHIDLTITDSKNAVVHLRNAPAAIELYPNNLLPDMKDL